MPWSQFSACWVLSRLFHSPLWLSSRGSLLLCFLPLRVVSSAYLRLLMFLPAILITACTSSSPAFLMMYSAYKLNKHGDNMQPWHTPFPIWNQSVVPCPVLSVASWPADRFLRRQDRWSGIPISLRIFHRLLWFTQSKALVQSVKQSRCFSGTLVLFRWSNGCWQFDLWLHKSLTKRAEFPPEAWTCLSQDDFCLGEQWWEERVRRCGLDSDSKPTDLTSHGHWPSNLLSCSVFL